MDRRSGSGVAGVVAVVDLGARVVGCCYVRRSCQSASVADGERDEDVESGGDS